MVVAKKLLVVLVVLTCFPSVLSSQIIHGQFIDFLQVLEDGALAGGNPNLVHVGACWYRRGNALHEDWRSWVDAYPTPPPGFPVYFDYEKFPETLNHEYESGTSIAHPTTVIAKNRVGIASFFFEPIPVGGGDPFFAVPTDAFDMSFSTIKSSVKFIDNYTENNPPPTPDAGFTSFHLRIRIDGPNNVTRTDLINALNEHQLSTYVQDDGGEWIELAHLEPITNEVVVGILRVVISDDYLDGDDFRIKVVLEHRTAVPLAPGEPGFPGWDWTPFEKLDPSDHFEQTLNKSTGISGQ